jgi:DNA-binding NtrC family response regulator
MPANAAKPETKKILIVEQEDHTRELLTSIIKLSGYDFEIAMTVEEALETLEKTSFDLLITDFTQPESKKLIESSQQKNPRLKSICLIRQSKMVLEAYSVSGAVFVAKPFCLDEMIRKIHQTIHERNLQEISVGFQQMKRDFLRMLS